MTSSPGKPARGKKVREMPPIDRSIPVSHDGARPPKMGGSEIIASVGIIIVAAALIGLVWIVCGLVIEDQRADLRARSESNLASQAATIAETVANELAMIDQSLSIMQSAWKMDSSSVDLKTWLSTMPALVALSDDIFIADEQHIIRQDILPQAVGQAIGANYMPTQRGSLEFLESNGTRTATPALAQMEARSQEPVNVRQFPMYLTRLLDHPDGWLLGASYKSTELPKLFAAAALGFNPVAALVDSRSGNIQAVAGPSARKPRTDLSKTPLFAAMVRSAPGVWLGETGIDDIKRLNAYLRVPNNDLMVVVGADWDEMMAPADQLASSTRELAAVATVLVLGVGGFALSSLYTVADRRRQRRLFHKAKEEIKRLQSDDSVNTVRTLLHAARLQTVIACASDGFAVFDGGMRLIQWNPHFEAIAVIPSGENLTLEMLVRQLVSRDGMTADEDAEITRRTEILRGGDPDGLTIPGLEGHDPMRLRGVPLALGGCVLMLTAVAGRPGLAAPPMAVRETPGPVSPQPARVRMEW